MSFIPAPGKTTIVIAIAIITIILFPSHWSYNNAQESITSIENKTNILRDPVGDESKLLGQNRVNQIRERPDVQPPFSLSRTQLILWITIIACVYTYAILWDSRDILSINQTALILMGISAGTFAAGAILDTAEIAQDI